MKDEENADFISDEENEVSSTKAPNFFLAQTMQVLRKLLIFLGVVLLIISVGGLSAGTAYFWEKRREKKIEDFLDKANEKNLSYYSYTEPISIKGNIDGYNPRQFIVTVVFGYTQGNKAAKNELKAREVLLKDATRNFFSYELAKDISSDNLEDYKEVLLEQVNVCLSQDWIEKVYFTDYMEN
jgi:flagellar basal body-associated protein FliL